MTAFSKNSNCKWLGTRLPGKPWIEFSLAVVLILLVGLCAFFAVNPGLHQWLHPDSDLEHQCVVTLFQKQQFDAPEIGQPMVAQSVGPECPAHFSYFLLVSPAQCGLFHSRAPPALFLL